MLEKTNRKIEKDARGDSGVLDDIVEGAAMRFSKVHTTPPRKREVANTDEPMMPEGRA